MREEILRLLRKLGVKDKEMLLETPRRVESVLSELCEYLLDSPTERQRRLKSLFKVFPSKTKEMVLFSDIKASSLCPHHLLPVRYDVNFAYIPRGKVLGVSKVPRVVSYLAHQPILQEDFTWLLAETFWKYLRPKGLMFVVRGTHSCMEVRGVKQSSTVTTSAVRGVFEQNEVKMEALRLWREKYSAN